MGEWFLIVIFLVLGIILINGGIRYQNGYDKHHFLVPGVRLGNMAWMSLPIGITCVLWALAPIPSLTLETSIYTAWVGAILGISGILVFFLGYLAALFQVSFMKPKWLRWLDQEHNSIRYLLRKEIKEMGYEAWDKRVNTQEKLEDWVEEVRRKHNK